MHAPDGLASGRIPMLAVVPMPPDSNPNGHVFGGWLMAQTDMAGAIPAMRRARARVSTVAVNSMTFMAPVFVGERVLFYADVVRVGNTSITVKIEVYTERNQAEPATVKVSEAQFVYVALDEHGKPQPVDGPRPA